MFSKLKGIYNNLIKLDPYERVFTNYNVEITLHNGEVYIHNDGRYWAWDSDDYIRYEILRKDKPILVCNGDEYYTSSSIKSVKILNKVSARLFYYDDWDRDVLSMVMGGATINEIASYNEKMSIYDS